LCEFINEYDYKGKTYYTDEWNIILEYYNKEDVKQSLLLAISFFSENGLDLLYKFINEIFNTYNIIDYI